MAVIAVQPEPPPPPPKRDYNTDYLKSPAGQLRIAEGVLSLLALICTAEGYCINDTGRYGYTLFVVIVSMLEAILLIVLFVLRLESNISFIDWPLSLLLNDGIMLINYFITTTLALLAIGRCPFGIPARVIGALFILGIFLVLIGLNYLNYLKYQERTTNGESPKNSGTTITESSPTVLQ